MRMRWGSGRRQGSRTTGSACIRRAAVSLAGAVVLSSCVLDADKLDLSVDLPQAYKESPSAAEAALPTLDWWRSFRSPELTSLMEQAIAANLDIAVAIAQIMQADAQVRIAGAPLLPTLN